MARVTSSDWLSSVFCIFQLIKKKEEEERKQPQEQNKEE